MTVLTELMALERTLWTNDADIYAGTYLPEAVLIFPGIGKIDLDFALEALRKEQAENRRWAEVSLNEAGTLDLGADVTLLTYRARARWNDESVSGSWLCSTVYVRRSEGWRIAMHQQTVAPKRKS